MKKIIWGLVVVALFLPVVSFAQSSSDIQSQIQALMAQVQALQAKLANSTGNSTTNTNNSTNSTFCHTFPSNLTIGNSGSEVQALQTALKREGFDVGNDTSNFTYNDNTAAAVSGFQEKYASEVLLPAGLKYGTGFVGKSTRAKLNNLYSCSAGQLSQLPQPAQSSIALSQSQYLPGDANGDSIVSSADIFYITNYLYNGGPMKGNGDANGDGIVSYADIIYLTNKLYNSPATSTPSITVLSPNGGEQIPPGPNNFVVTYSVANIANLTNPQLTLQLLKDGTVLGYVSYDSNGAMITVYSDSQYWNFSWQPGFYYDTTFHTAPPGSGYKIRATLYSNGNRVATDDSDMPFTISSPTLSVAAPTITSITPNQGTANTVVTIYGTNLTGATEVDFYNSSNQFVGSSNGNITVSSGGSPAQFVLNGILVANITQGTYQIRVVTPSGTSNAWPFTITATSAAAPIIESITPNQGTANTVITIYGTNFDSGSYILFGNQTITPIYRSSSQLQFAVPNLPAGLQNIHVGENASNVFSNAATFTIITSTPTLQGDVDGNGTVDVNDVTYLINYLFAKGPAPKGNADANGDGTVTVADVFYLINKLQSNATLRGDVDGNGVVDNNDVTYLTKYLFSGGPAPKGNADANGDGAVTSADIFYLNNILSGTLKGDVDGNGVVNGADLDYLVNYLFAGGPIPKGNADANGDGAITPADIFYMVNNKLVSENTSSVNSTQMASLLDSMRSVLEGISSLFR